MKRAIAITLVFLLLGAVVNVAVAWGFSTNRSFYEEVPSAPAMFPPHGWLDLETRRFWGGILHARRGCYGVEVMMSFEMDAMMEREGMTTDDELLARLDMWREAGVRDLPRWCAVRSFPSVAVGRIDDLGEEVLTDRAFGWPMLAMTCHWRGWVDEDAMTYRRDIKWGVSLTSKDSPLPPMPGLLWQLGLTSPWVLPLRPIASGFFINTIIFAVLLWLIFAAPFALRRMIRRRRGQCEKCAYPIGVSPVCTECGSPVSPRPGP